MRMIAILAVAALAACSGGDDAANNQATAKAGFREARIGIVGLEYESAKLAIAPVQVKLPPDYEREVPGMKLIAKSREAAIDQPQCPGRPENLCAAEAEGGMTLTLINRPLAQFSAPIRNTRPVNVAGRDGLTWVARFGGTEATYTLLPVEQQTLLMIRQTGGQAAPDAATLDAVIASIDFNAEEPRGKGK